MITALLFEDELRILMTLFTKKENKKKETKLLPVSAAKKQNAK